MLIFAGINLYGFFKCSKDQQGKLNKLGTKAVSNLAREGIRNIGNQL